MSIRNRRAIHQTADQSLVNAKGDPKQLLLLYLLIVTGLSLAASVISVLLSNRIADTGGLGNMGLRSVLSTAKAVLPLAQSLIFLGLEMGYCTAALNISRGEQFSRDTLFGGFRRFFPLLRAQILLGFLYFGVAMISLYPSVYIFLLLPMSKGFYDVMTPLMESASVLTEPLILDEATMAAATEAMMPVFWIFAAMFLLLFIPIHYNYRLAVYRLIDQPRPGALRALRESRSMMRRNRFALFRLDLDLWWFYVLQALIMILCYGDMLLPLVGIALPWSETASYFIFLSLSLLLQFVVYYCFMNRVAVTYATAYGTLLPTGHPKESAPASAHPWQNQY